MKLRTIAGAVALVLILALGAFAQGPAKTQVTDTLYDPDGSLASGTIIIENPATFTSADGYVVPRTTIAVLTVTNGAVSVALVPNAGSSPSGTYYSAQYILANGTFTENWVVPSVGPVSLAAIRATVPPELGFLFPMSQITPPPNCVSLGGLPDWNGTSWTCVASSGSGTVTSFSAGGLSPLFTASVGTPTSTPSLAFALTNQNANLVYAGPGSGVAAAPSFRALVAADIPALPYVSNNSGTANLFLATPNGASGAPSLRAIVAADVPTLNQSTTGNAATATALSTTGSNGQFWGVAGGVQGWNTPAGSGNVSTSGSPLANELACWASGTTITGTGADTTTTHALFATATGCPAFRALASGDIPALPYVSNASGSANLFLATPNGSSGAPSLRAIVAADVPTLNQATTADAGGLTGCAPATAGSVCYWNGSAWALLAGNSSGTNWLQETSAGVPSWTAPGGGGTVTSFSAGGLSPLFTTSVATPTSTPALTFALSSAAQNSVFAGPATGGAGAPSFQTAPTISAANMTNFPTLNQNTTGTAATITGAVALANTPLTALGDILAVNSTPALARVAGNTTAVKNFLVQTGTGSVSALPLWGTIAAGDVPTLNQSTTGTAGGLTGCAPATAGSVCYWNGSAWALLAGNSSGTNWLQETSAGVPSWTAPGGGGTVTSFSAGGLSPLFTTSVATPTSTPALTFALANQNANLIYAGPASGVAAAPSFRALVAADIPALPYVSNASGAANLFLATPNGASGAPLLRAIVAADIPTLNQNTTGSAGSLSATLPASEGGTGDATLGAYGVLIGEGTSAVHAVGPGTAKQMLLSGGGTADPSYADFEDTKEIPAANCNGSTPGTGWSLPASGGATAACRSGTNVQAGVLQFADGNSAQFQFAVPGDWDSAGTVYARVRLTQGANTTSGQTIIMSLATACSTTTDDPAFNTAQNFTTATTTATANTPFDETLSAVTMTGCTAGHTLNLKISRATDTATTAPNVYFLDLTFPRLITPQAN